ncbi:MAG: outer membrane lipoprotein-sorting protein [Cytophagales bacterium]|nr:outer membrane lipoprotein-sorting protein [Cytophagales bacterium]
MKSIQFLSVMVLALLISCGAIAQNLTGREIIQKVKDRPDGDTRYSEMSMKLINKRGSSRDRKVVSNSMDLGKDKKTIMFFLYPGDVKGTGFLTWDYDEIGKDDDKWLYLPAMKKTRRISGASAKKDYFMGTDFTYDDMGSRNVDEDTHKLLREETMEGHKCWVVESTSKDKRDIYSKKISWIHQDCLIALKVEYYDKLAKLHRELKLSNIKKVDGFWVAHQLHMTNVQTNHQTILTIENPKYNIDINESLFTVAKLEQGSL